MSTPVTWRHAPKDHDHDDRYYTETEIDGLLDGVSVYERGDLPTGADLNDLHETAHWVAPRNSLVATLVNWPPQMGGLPGHLEVLGADNGLTIQRVTGRGSAHKIVQRYVNSVTTGAWVGWTQVWPPEDAADGWDKGDIPAGQDMDTLTTPGVYGVRSGAVADGIVNGPDDRGAGVVEVLATSNGIHVQRWTYNSASQGMRIRTTNGVTAGTWTQWGDPWSGGGDPVPVYAGIEAFTTHTIRESMFMQAMGGPIDTQGKAAVAFRMDHGFANFATELLPLFRARGIVPSMVYNPRNWGRAENDGYTATDLNAWVAAGEVEVWNHGADHSDVSSDADLHDQIVNSLAEIEAEVPAAAGKVWGFAPPGVDSTTGYGGYGSGSTPEKWDTTAGRLILKHHAVTAAYLYGTGTRPLDGQIRQGQSHYTMDNYSVAEIKARIDTGIARGHGVQLMIHPSRVNTTGYPTTAQVEEVLDYVVAKRDAGSLVTLSPYQMLVADSTRPPAGGLYDSGELDITAAFSPISGGAYLSRFGPLVTMQLSGLVVSDTAQNFMQWEGAIPTGYRPARNTDFGLTARTTTEYDSTYSGFVASDGKVTIYKIEPGEAQRAVVTWRTPDPEPA